MQFNIFKKAGGGGGRRMFPWLRRGQVSLESVVNQQKISEL